MTEPYFVPTEEMEGKEIVYYERLSMPMGQQMLIRVEDVITTMTHPLNGRAVTAPSAIVAKIFVRWDHVVTHQKMQEQIEHSMGLVEEDP